MTQYRLVWAAQFGLQTSSHQRYRSEIKSGHPSFLIFIYALIESQDSNSERKCSLFCNLMCWLPASSPTPFPRQASQCCSAAENSNKHHSASVLQTGCVHAASSMGTEQSACSAAESGEQSHLAMQRRRQAACRRGFCSSTDSSTVVLQ